MSKRNLLMLLAMGMVAFMSTPAWALLAGFNIDVHMDIDPTGRTIANDFHIKGTVKSGLPDSNWQDVPQLVMQIGGGFPNFQPSPFTFQPINDPLDPGAQNTFAFEAAWSGRDVVYCETIHLGLLFDVTCHNTVIDIVGWWTYNGEPLKNGQNGGRVLIPGFTIDERLSPQVLQIRNDSQTELDPGIGGHVLQTDLLVLTAEQMQQMFGAPEELFAELNAKSPLQQQLDWVTSPNTGGDFPADSFFDVFVEIDLPGTGPMHIDPGGFLISRTLVEFPGNTGEPERHWVWHFHQAHNDRDWGDAPEITDNSGLIAGYPTRAWLNGASHVIRGPWMGPADDAPDPEPDGQPDPAALGDDNNGAKPDDEDGVQIPVLIQGVADTIIVQISGAGAAAPAWLDAWIDYNGDTIWQAAERIFGGPVGPGMIPIPVTAPVGSIVGQTFARFRVSTVQGGLAPTGPAPDGEVEDHEVFIEQQPQQKLDFGDAPDPRYPTLLASNGARHLIVAGAPWLGPDDDRPDAEFDGQPNVNADGDDINGASPDDEDGVLGPIVLQQGKPDVIVVLVNDPGGLMAPWLDVWVDWNYDGDWLDPGEQVFAGNVAPGPLAIPVTAPVGVPAQHTYARFRINRLMRPLQPDGIAENGEVEDHIVKIMPGNVEIDQFPNTEGELELQGPDGTIQSVFLTGPVQMHVYFEGAQEGDAVDDNGNGRDEVDTEMVSMNLTGGSIGPIQVHLNHNLPSPGVMEEEVNNTPGTLDVAPFAATGAVDSFFDVFTVLSIDTGGQVVMLTPAEPIRLRARITHKPSIDCDEVYESVERIELLDDNGQPTGIFINRVVIKPVPCLRDFGDAPDNTQLHYNTLLANNGARHRIDPDVHLGALIDAEPDGQATAMDARGDDLNGAAPDDEDGVTFLPGPYFLLRPGKHAMVEVSASVDGFLSLWIDFAQDFNWTQASDRVFDALPISAGLNTLVFNVPLDARPNSFTMSRFRFATEPVHDYQGEAKDGEVEDYAAIIRSDQGIKWRQSPDVTRLGIDINVSTRLDIADDIQRVLADDFACTSIDPITDVHLWGSWKNDEVGKIKRIHLSIHSDDPATPDDPADAFSKPGELLWEGDFFEADFGTHLYVDVKEGEHWWDPWKGELLFPGDKQIYQVDVKIDPKEAFLQKGTPEEPIIYWLDVQVDTVEGDFGWKTRRYPDHYNDDAVRLLMREPGAAPIWQDMRYPDGHPLNDPATGKPAPSIDMAFVITNSDFCPGCGDLNCDGIVNLADLAILAEQYMTNGRCN